MTLLPERREAPVLGITVSAEGKEASTKVLEGEVWWTYLHSLSGPWWAQL